jgi:hypothetical protein
MGFLAYIVPVDAGNRPDNALPGQPPGIWGGAPPYVDIGGPGQQPGVSHPIAPGGRPPGIWGGPPNYVDIGGPGQQPGVSHPIAPGGPPLGTWGGVSPPQIGYPLPPTEGGGGDKPPVIWPGTPSFPIVLPPEPPEEGEKPPVYMLVWIPGVGWVWYPGNPGNVVSQPIQPTPAPKK